MNPTAKELVVRLIDDALREGHRIRYTVDADGVPDKIAAIDAVAELCGCSSEESSNKYRRLTSEVSDKTLDLDIIEKHQFPGAGQRPTPVVRPSELVRVISALPRNKYPRVDQFQRACSNLVTRYMNGDTSLIPEICENTRTALIANHQTLDEKEEKREPRPAHPLVINGVSIICRASDGYINATELCRASQNKRKKFNDWYRLSRTKDLITELSNRAGIPARSLLILGHGDKEGHAANHTWVHRKLAYHIAMWISPKFAVQVGDWLDELLVTGSVMLKREKSSEEIEAMYKRKIECVQHRVLELEDKLSFHNLESHTIESIAAQYNHFDVDDVRDSCVVYVISVGETIDVDTGLPCHAFVYGQSQDFGTRLKDYERLTTLTRILLCVRVVCGLTIERKITAYVNEHSLKCRLPVSDTSSSEMKAQDDKTRIMRESFATREDHSITRVLAAINQMYNQNMLCSEHDVRMLKKDNEIISLKSEVMTLKYRLLENGIQSP